MGTGVLSPGINSGRGVTLTTHRHLVPRLWISRSYTSSPPASLWCAVGLLFYVLCITVTGSLGKHKWSAVINTFSRVPLLLYGMDYKSHFCGFICVSLERPDIWFHISRFRLCLVSYQQISSLWRFCVYFEFTQLCTKLLAGNLNTWMAQVLAASREIDWESYLSRVYLSAKSIWPLNPPFCHNYP
jgi:hypothetical protein